MVLFINTDRNQNTGWHGYDFAVNRKVLDSRSSRVEFTNNGWNWCTVAEARFKVEANEIMLSVNRKALMLPAGSAPLEFEFKWADNFRLTDNIDAFTLNGDSAPPGRFNYRYYAK